ncbi:hypothetical protein GN956_G2415 [Arapaima gigas]
MRAETGSGLSRLPSVHRVVLLTPRAVTVAPGSRRPRPGSRAESRTAFGRKFSLTARTQSLPSVRGWLSVWFTPWSLWSPRSV